VLAKTSNESLGQQAQMRADLRYGHSAIEQRYPSSNSRIPVRNSFSAKLTIRCVWPVGSIRSTAGGSSPWW
jgi:hypothetical protein